jgi:hypothetical protein
LRAKTQSELACQTADQEVIAGGATALARRFLKRWSSRPRATFDG